jgi:hypothetical protein
MRMQMHYGNGKHRAYLEDRLGWHCTDARHVRQINSEDPYRVRCEGRRHAARAPAVDMASAWFVSAS